MTNDWQMSTPSQYSLKNSKYSVHVDLGCGSLPRNPLEAQRVIGIDVLANPPFVVSNMSVDYKRVLPGDPLPFETAQIDSVSAFDFLEHIPRVDRSPDGDFKNPFIEMMNEVHRILKPGGLFISLTPCFPSAAAFSDPTHVNFISEETHLYFSGENFAKTKGYGFFGEFKLIEASWSDWRGSLWDSYAIKESANLELHNEKRDDYGKSLVKRTKLMLRKRILGHTGETHFLWVLQKSESSRSLAQQ
jgi:SAM-dependent methyltransferase